MKKSKLLFTSSRPLSWINTAFPFAAGYLFFTESIDATFTIGSLFFLIPYNLLMYGINDVYDYESDLQNPRKGGIEGAVVPKKYHRFLLAWSYLLPVPFIAALGFLVPQSLVVLIACVFFVIAYSAKHLRFKEIPFLDSITSSLHFVGPLIFALSIVGWSTETWPIVIAFFMWGMASQSLGAIQDIAYDKKAGIASIGTVVGEKGTLVFSLACYLTAIILILPLGMLGVLAGIAASAYVANILPALTARTRIQEKSRASWKRFLWINYLVGAAITMLIIAAYLTQ
jgi:4-hydroxybenzoate polyprenyltransferase